MKTSSIPVTISIAAACMLLTACRQQAETSAPGDLASVKVRVEAIQARTRVATEEVVGTIRARFRAVMEAKVSGSIERLPVVPGQSVKAGDLLVQLGAQEIQARFDQAVAQRDQYKRDAERLRALLENRAVSRQETETVESHYKMAVAAVAEAQTLLGYTKIMAPFDGVITRKHVEIGDLAAPGKPLVELEDPRSLRLEADVPEAAISGVVLGASLRVRTAGITNELQATVSEIAPAADPNTRTFLVKCDIPAGFGVRAGQFGRLSVPLGETSALRVSAAALVQRGQMELVFVSASGRAQMRLVKTGKRVGSEIELLSGVSAGEQVITEGASSLRDGQPVEVAR